MAGSQPAGRSKDGMCSFSLFFFFFQKQRYKGALLKDGSAVDWIIHGVELVWLLCLFLRVHLKFLFLVEQLFSTLITNGEGEEAK